MNFKINVKYLNGVAFGFSQPTCIVNIEQPINQAFDTSVKDKIIMFLNKITDGEIKINKLKIEDFDFIFNIIKLYYYHSKIPVFNNFRLNHTISKNQNKIFIYSYEYYDKDVFDFILKSIVKIIESIINNPVDILEEIYKEFMNNISTIKNRINTGLNIYYMLQFAHENNIPYWKIHYDNNIYCAGYGNNSTNFNSTNTNFTDSIFKEVAKNKLLTKKILKDRGLPVADGFEIRNIEDLKNKILNIGYPIVIKPFDKDGGLGVFNNIKNEASLFFAYKKALKISNNLMVEKHIEGKDYRFNLYNNEIINITFRIPGGITGNGKDNILKLLDIANEDIHIKKTSKKYGRKILSLDEEAIQLLKENNLNPNSILEKNRFFPLRRKANISSGGKSINISTHEIHPDNINLVKLVSDIMKLDFMGIDIIMPDIKKSWLNTSASILEINSQPQLNPDYSYKAFKLYFDNALKNNGHIDSKLIVTDSLEYQNEILSKLLRDLDPELNIGIRSKEGVYISNSRLKNSSTFSEDSKLLYSSKKTEKIFLICTFDEILNSGIPICRIDDIILISNNLGKNILEFSKDFLKDNCKRLHEMKYSTIEIMEIINND